MSAQDRRHDRRAVADSNATLIYDGENFQVQLHNISSSGARVAKPAEWTPKSGDDFEIALATEEELRVWAKLIWSSDQAAGIKFVLDAASSKILEAFIASLETEESAAAYQSAG